MWDPTYGNAELLELLIDFVIFLVLCLISNHFGAWGCAEYARFLMHKYGNLNNKVKKNDVESRELMPYRLSYEQNYKTTYRG